MAGISDTADTRQNENKPDSVPEPASPTCEVPGAEIGGAKGPEPTRYGDWQHKGRVSDF
jgi:hypothetical protein